MSDHEVRDGARTGERSAVGETGIVLRPMTPADLDQVLELERAVFGDEAWTRQMLAGELQQQPASRCYLVADDAGCIAGYAGLLGAGWQGDVLTLAVATTRWGNGIGSALLEALLAEAARRGCTEVFLEVRADNTRAQRLYRRHGFTEIGIRRGYYQPSGEDAVVMRRSLSGARRTGERR
jgi:[ribosomal protein S18]-alanine N-acetyltransferase